MEHIDRSAYEQFVRRVRRLGAQSPNRRAMETYWLSKEIDGRREGTGTFPLFGLRVAKLSLLSNGHRAFYEPLSSYDELLKLSRMNARLVEGGAPSGALNQLPVSVRLFESAYNAPLGELPLPAHSEREQGVHQVSLNGTWLRAGCLQLLFRNSWGEWGYEGSGMISREYLERYMVEAWLARRGTIGPSKFTRPLLALNAADPKRYVRVWMLGSPLLRALNSWAIESTVCHRGAEHTIQLYESLSASEDPVEIIEVRDPSGVPLGWVHLHHLVDAQQRVSVAKEFFIWPLVRSLGYGRLLEDFAVARTRKWGSKQLSILFHEADDYPSNLTRAKAFATGAGYEWKWVLSQRPRISAVAEKNF